MLTFMYDVKQWMEGIAKAKLSNHVHQHQFKLELSADGKSQNTRNCWLSRRRIQKARGSKSKTIYPLGFQSMLNATCANLIVDRLFEKEQKEVVRGEANNDTTEN